VQRQVQAFQFADHEGAGAVHSALAVVRLEGVLQALAQHVARAVDGAERVVERQRIARLGAEATGRNQVLVHVDLSRVS
jgi:hypothetical protein